MSWIEVSFTATITKKENTGYKRKKIYTDHCLEFKVQINEEIMNKIKEVVDGDIYIISIKLISSCSGCRSDQPNQLAHMDPGGCLYDPNLDT